MAASMDSDEEESFVSLGVALEQFNEDDLRKKPVSVQDLPAKDQKGRSRFHGAFTGGFSAGHFNTVGSKEGFMPTAFVSSRNKKDDNEFMQRPEDFMDEEDFGEYGIAPRKLVTAGKYGSQERRKREIEQTRAMTSGMLFGGEPAIADLITPEKLTIGVKLLRKLGWKEGQGLGPRERRQGKSKPQPKRTSDPTVKTYGCALPPTACTGTVSDSNSDDDSSHDLPNDVTFAPRDTTPISFVAKDNVQGLGYSGLNPRAALPSTHINLFDPPPITKSGRKSIRGQAFGVGALEEEDEDIYSTDHLSNYDMTMEIDEDKEDLYGWTAPGRNKGGYQKTPVGYVGSMLEGFTLSAKKLKPKKNFGPPNLPKDFKPIHKFHKSVQSITEQSLPVLGVTAQPDGKQKKMDAVTRGLALGETPVVDSVFDLVSDKDKQRIGVFKQPRDKSVKDPSDSQSGQKNRVKHKSRFHQPESESSDDMLNDQSTSSQPVTASSENVNINTDRSQVPLFQGGNASFKPFSRDPAKQERYDRYLALSKAGRQDAYEEVTEGHMTEWEKEHEKEEFIHASKLYKPLSGMMASRFTSAKYDDNTNTEDVPVSEAGDKTDQMKAAEMKMYGQLTHEEFEWHPHKMLSWRFNVPNPYPGSSIVGLPSVKRDKYSVFNFLNFSNEPETTTEEMLALPAPDEQPKESKPVSFGLKQRSQVSTNLPMKSIFSDIVDDTSSGSSKPPDINMETKETPSGGEGDNQEEKDQIEKPPVDLFSAIFGNTDSEDASEEEKEEEKEDEMDSTSKPREESTHQTSSSVSEQQSDVEPVQALQAPDSPQYLPGTQQEIPSLQQRLSPQSPPAEEIYGPALPPPGAPFPESSASAASSTIYIDLTSSSHRKHRHKDRHKHKKEKKSKHKKEKHKHKEKKKGKKHKRRDYSE